MGTPCLIVVELSWYRGPSVKIHRVLFCDEVVRDNIAISTPDRRA